MIPPSNFDEEIRRLRQNIKTTLEQAAKETVAKEIENILGRVKIFVGRDLQQPDRLEWFIEHSNRDSLPESKK